MPVDLTSLFVLIFVVLMANHAINRIRRHRQEARDKEVDRKVGEALQQKAVAAEQGARTGASVSRAATNATSPEVNNDPRLVIPFRGGSATGTDTVAEAESKAEMDQTADAAEQASSREQVLNGEKAESTGAVFARDNSYAEYQEPTIYRQNPSWTATGRDWAVVELLAKPGAVETEISEPPGFWSDGDVVTGDAHGAEAKVLRHSRRRSEGVSQKLY